MKAAKSDTNTAYANIGYLKSGDFFSDLDTIIVFQQIRPEVAESDERD
jgi:hypothetical protein